MKTVKKAIALVLCTALCLGLIATAALAYGQLPELDNDKVKYVALGDSMSQGYMFTDYNENASEGHGEGWLGSSERSYIKLFAKDLEEEFGAENFELIDLSLQGLQPDELYYMFKYVDGEAEDAYLTPGAQKHIRWWLGNVFPDEETMCSTYVDSIKAADILTYDIGINYFGTYVSDRLSGEDAGKQQDAPENRISYFLEKLSPEAGKLVEDARAKLLDFAKGIEGVPAETLDEAVNAYLYAFASYIYYFDKTVDYIYSVNPDVKMIVLPLFSPHQQLYFDVNGSILPFSAFQDTLMDILNLYIRTLNPNCTKYSFVDYQNSPMSFVDELYFNADNASEDLRVLVFEALKTVYGVSSERGLFPMPEKIQADITANPQNYLGEYYLASVLPLWMGLEGTPENIQMFLEMVGAAITEFDLFVSRDENGEIIKNKEGKYLFRYSAYDQMIYDYIADKYGDDVAFNTIYGPDFLTVFMAGGGNPAFGPGPGVFGDNLDSKGYWTPMLENDRVEIYKQHVAAGTAAEWEEIVVEAVNAYDAKFAEVSDAAWDACVKAATYRVYPIDFYYAALQAGGDVTVLQEQGYDVDYTRTFLDPENATDYDYLLLHWMLRHSSAARGFGAHPCPLGQLEKYNTVKKAYASKTNPYFDVITGTQTIVSRLSLNIGNLFFSVRNLINNIFRAIKNAFTWEGIFTAIENIIVNR